MNTLITKPRVTVLGARGFVGSHLVAHLTAQGYDCHAPARGAELGREPMGHVIYAIGLTADFRSRPLDTVEAHVCVLRQLIASGNFDSLTYLSSTRVYTGASDTSETAVLRVNPNDPSDLYNISKLMGESLCLHAGLPNIRIARLSNIVGLRPDPDIFIDQLLEEGRRSGKVVLRTALTSKKDYLYIDDAVSLLTRIALSAEHGIFNVASGEAVENGDIARFLERDMGFAVSVLPDAPEWYFAPVDVSKVRTHFGFAPVAFSEYFPRYLSRYKAANSLQASL
ncbi:NAD(P)-dependent oxidoreductase [Pigmentiphaga aceris]|uniref:NAD(P)-dependent oxidoreductase n=1 Tax=Pigmentiphaga aceris TaxID=1940612 RepID=A0A5C0B0L3_9BURK|nr:NAD(P)-dependent oxidoreductase [Pigmentiphaga aceris]QEI07243.1 NAD(P)-dependent oxidoreductase [Pigmentiphaga aceris]